MTELTKEAKESILSIQVNAATPRGRIPCYTDGDTVGGKEGVNMDLTLINTLLQSIVFVGILATIVFFLIFVFLGSLISKFVKDEDKSDSDY